MDQKVSALDVENIYTAVNIRLYSQDHPELAFICDKPGLDQYVDHIKYKVIGKKVIHLGTREPNGFMMQERQVVYLELVLNV